MREVKEEVKQEVKLKESRTKSKQEDKEETASIIGKKEKASSAPVIPPGTLPPSAIPLAKKVNIFRRRRIFPQWNATMWPFDFYFLLAFLDVQTGQLIEQKWYILQHAPFQAPVETEPDDTEEETGETVDSGIEDSEEEEEEEDEIEVDDHDSGLEEGRT